MAEPAWVGVIGYPVAHSISPAIFLFLAQKTGKPVCYQKLQVPPNQLDAVVPLMKKLGWFYGWNITIPHKTAILNHINMASEEVRITRAANVVLFENNRLWGFNTDIAGVEKTFEEQGFDPAGQNVLLLGAGGAARAVAYVLAKKKAKTVFVWSRKRAHARELIANFSRMKSKTRFDSVVNLDEFSQLVALYVNATPVGMKGFPNASLLPQQVTEHALAFDLVYRPEETIFLRDAKAKGLRTVGGLDMLIWQAFAAYEIWFGKISHKKEVKEELKKFLRRTVP